MPNNDSLSPILYLDIDGVLLPFDDQYRTDEFPFDMKELNALETYSPEVVKRIGETCLNLVWCSTWSQSEVEYITEQMDALRDGRHLSLPPRSYKTRISQKLDTIMIDQKNYPTPFIWVDDEITDKEQTRVREQFTRTPHLLLRPNRNIGLDKAELCLIENFQPQISGIKYQVFPATP